MPFARVGAMPQPTPSKKKTDERKKFSNGASKPRGITIEVSHSIARRFFDFRLDLVLAFFRDKYRALVFQMKDDPRFERDESIR